ncbi:MAG: metal ABC transporter permease [Chloroflexota bacterium]|nr:metal ABC transporter permease [Chloroflexota bacterium]
MIMELGVSSPLAAVVAVLGLEWSYTLRNVVAGAAVLGVVGGVLGSFATLRRQSLLGDTLAHAALPGVCIAYIITGSRESLPLMIGAGLSGLVGTLFYLLITRTTRIKDDAGLGIVLSTGFGLGLLLLTYVQNTGGSGQSGLDRFLFGQAASLVRNDVITMSILGAIALATVGLLFKEFKLLSFDPDFAASIGYPTTMLTILITALLIVAVVIGLQAVGVILVVAILIAPASAARQWTDQLSTMLVLSGLFGAVSGAIGAILSSQITDLPTGPAVVLIATTLTAISLLAAPRRGLLWAAISRRRHRQRVQLASILHDLADAAAGEAGAVIPLTDLQAKRGVPGRLMTRQLAMLASRGLVARSINGREGWSLTAAGAEATAEASRRERVWKQYMARQMDLPVDAIHYDATEIERVLPPEALAMIEAELRAEDAAAIGRASDVVAGPPRRPSRPTARPGQAP